MSYAQYNLHDDKLKFFPSTRLPDEEYQAFRKAGMAWWRGSKCLAGVWTPEREDMILQYVDEIPTFVDDDTGFSYRLERFGGYSDNAADRAAAHQDRLDDLIENGPPMGQPILVGHHSERQARKLQKQIDSTQRKAAEEQDRADYWAYRLERAEKHHAFKERPDVIFRRIQKYEQNLRRCQKNKGLAENTTWWNLRNGKSEESEQKRQVYLTHVQRWIDHLESVIAYQRELYEKSGGIVADRKADEMEVGGAVRCWCSRDRFIPIISVNKTTVTVPDTHNELTEKDDDGKLHYKSVFTRTIEKDKLTAVISKAEFEQHAHFEHGQMLLRGLVSRQKPKVEPGVELVKGCGVEYKHWSWFDGRTRWGEMIRKYPKSILVLTHDKPDDKVGREVKISIESIRGAMPPAQWQEKRAELINAYYDKCLKPRN